MSFLRPAWCRVRPDQLRGVSRSAETRGVHTQDACAFAGVDLVLRGLV